MNTKAELLGRHEMSDNAVYRSDSLSIYEWPQPCCEILYTDTDHGIAITSKEDAEAIITSLTRFLAACGE